MPYAIRITQPGGPAQLAYDAIELTEPKAGEVLLKQTAIGVNYIDVYHRTGLYPQPSYPAGIGLEGAGIIEAVGEGVTRFKVGDRVAYCGGPIGGYATHRVMAAKHLVALPAGIEDDIAASIMLKGLTVQYLLRRTASLQAGQTVLMHAAAGGVGLLFCQWAKHLGITVIGTVGSEEKAAIAKAYGCTHTILYRKENFAKKVKDITQGKGVDVVYDSVGKDTALDSLDCLKPFGLLVSFGQSSGPIPPLDLSLLSQKGSLYITRPTLMHHLQDDAWYQSASQELFALVEQGVLTPKIAAHYPLEQAASAHQALESRQTSGALVLTVAI
ncbi:MAG: quinone oxidoreductase [Rickettsiales bacterium]|nr:quinone oxidoreductase [Rickettsiales bacterium]